MSSLNPFDLLEDDVEDPSRQLIAAEQIAAEQKAAAAPPPKKPSAPEQQKTQTTAKLPSKPSPPAQAVREEKPDNGRVGGRGRGSGRGRGVGYTRDFNNNENSFRDRGASGGQGNFEGGDYEKPYERRGYGYGGRVSNRDSGNGGGFNRDFTNNENSFTNSTGVPGGQGNSGGGDYERTSERRGYAGPRASGRGGGGRRSGYNDEGGFDGDHPRRAYERRSGTGRGNEFKREGAGSNNWGTSNDDIAQDTEGVNRTEKPVEESVHEQDAVDGSKQPPVVESESKKAEEEDKEMTLEEYEKVLEENRKALLVNKSQERKVDVAKEFGSMQPLSNKKSSEDIFIKLGSEKDKRKELADKEEKAKKSVSIHEFLKPAEGEIPYNISGRGRGRGRGGGRGFSGYGMNNVSAPQIEDPSQFPTLGVK